MSENPILDAANELDPMNNEHWTGQNLPALGPLNKILSDAGYEDVKRGDVNDAIPEFTRPFPETEDNEEDSKPDEASFEGDMSTEKVNEIREAIEEGSKELDSIEGKIAFLRETSQVIRNSIHEMASQLREATPNFSELHRISRENQRKRVDAEVAKNKRLLQLANKLATEENE